MKNLETVAKDNMLVTILATIVISPTTTGTNEMKTMDTQNRHRNLVAMDQPLSPLVFIKPYVSRDSVGCKKLTFV